MGIICGIFASVLLIMHLPRKGGIVKEEIKEEKRELKSIKPNILALVRDGDILYLTKAMLTESSLITKIGKERLLFVIKNAKPFLLVKKPFSKGFIHY